MLPVSITAASVVTVLVSGWMTTMFLLLRHSHYAERAIMSMAICTGALAVAAGGWRGPAPLRATLALWAIALVGLGLWALFGNSGDDAWILIAGMVFVVEGALALAGVARATASAGTA
jgi:hypothetical protein